jgi:hypothetical protein
LRALAHSCSRAQVHLSRHFVQSTFRKVTIASWLITYLCLAPTQYVKLVTQSGSVVKWMSVTLPKQYTDYDVNMTGGGHRTPDLTLRRVSAGTMSEVSDLQVLDHESD